MRARNACQDTQGAEKFRIGFQCSYRRVYRGISPIRSPACSTPSTVQKQIRSGVEGEGNKLGCCGGVRINQLRNYRVVAQDPRDILSHGTEHTASRRYPVICSFPLLLLVLLYS